MRRDEVVREMHRCLKHIGVADHLCSVRKVPSGVNLRVLIGSDEYKIDAQSGIDRGDLIAKLRLLAIKWRQYKRGQRRLEEAIAEKGNERG